MFDNVSKCAPGGGSRLVKAKSSPNVSKAALSSARKQIQSNQPMTSPTIAPNKTSRFGKPPTPSRISIKMPNDAVNPPRRASTNLDSSKSRLVVPSKPSKRSLNEARPDVSPAKTASAATRDKKKVCKSASSCTILEDRALLKKGLTYTPENRPAKPETLRRKGLDRSVSLSSVSSDSQMTNSATSSRWIPIFSDRRSAEKEKKTELSGKSLTFINRSTSLWNVRTPRADNNQCGKTSGSPARLNSVSRPSKIPLPASRSTGLGRSLADLSQVDRAEEIVGRTIISFELDLDAASDERIYENCRETLDRASKFNSARSTSMSNLEERAARLMAQLEDDLEPKESVDVANVAPPCRTKTVYEDRETLRTNDISIEKCDFEDDKSNEISRTDEKAKRKWTTISKDISKVQSENDLQRNESVIRESKSNQIKSCDPDEFTKDSRKNKENSIQELRRNWEKQSGGITNQNTDAKTTTHATNSGRMTVNLSKATRTGNDVVDDVQETKRKQCVVGKRAKDIEHLVNFFNCKNAEVKETPREVLIKPRSVDVPIIETPALKKNESKTGNEYSGYVSDGNCSEDSGHMSNENEVEWKETMENQGQRETSEFKGQQYFGRINRNDDNDDAKIFEPTIVHRLTEPEKKKVVVKRNDPLMSNDANSTDNCRDDRCSENGRQVRVERLWSRALLTLNADSPR